MKKTDMAKPYIRAGFQKNIGNLCGLLFGMVLGTVVNMLISILLQFVIDMAGGDDRYTFGQLLLMTLGIGVLVWIGGLMEREWGTRFRKRANLQYKGRIFQDITKKSIAAFSSEHTETYISMLTNDAGTVEEKYFRGTADIIQNVLFVVFGLATMVWYSWQLALVAVVLSCLPVVAGIAFGGVLAKSEKRVSDCNAGFVATVKNLLSGFSIVKSFQAEKETGQQFGNENGVLETAKFHRSRISMLVQMISSSAAIVMQFGLFFAGAVYARKGLITAGTILALLNLSGQVVGPLIQLPQQLAERKAARGLISKAAEALSGNVKKAGGKPIPALEEGIACHDLRFAYEEGKNILRGVELEMKPGRSYAIVGASGSGKSTLLNLFLGSYDSYRGSVTIGGREIREADTDSLYALLSIIQQNVFVFDATIEENITMFKAFPEEAIEDAIRRSGLEALVAEKGRGYRCGENGCNLSGGERQRISIARCLLKNTQVLLMDEATAALDAQTASNVTNAILDVEGLTRIIVTHKLDEAILRRFDEILVMRGGVIAERGTYSQLLDEKGYFYALCAVSETM